MDKKDLSYSEQLVLESIPTEPCGKHHKEIANSLSLGYYEVRKIIKNLRNMGYPICSNPHEGYWMARDERELLEVISMLQSYITSMQNTVDALLETLLFKRG